MKNDNLLSYAAKHLLISWHKDTDGPGYICLVSYRCDPKGDVASVRGGFFFGKRRTKAIHELKMIQEAIDDLCNDPCVNRSHFAAFAAAWPIRSKAI